MFKTYLRVRRMPEPLRIAYQDEWRVAYAGLRPWGRGDGSTGI
jgi:hypothetical protein